MSPQNAAETASDPSAFATETETIDDTVKAINGTVNVIDETVTAGCSTANY